jgi:hypothetical protein
MLVVHNNQHPESLFKPQLMIRCVPLHVLPYNQNIRDIYSVALKCKKQLIMIALNSDNALKKLLHTANLKGKKVN